MPVEDGAEEIKELVLLLDGSCRPIKTELFDNSSSLVFEATGAAEAGELMRVGEGSILFIEGAFGIDAGQKLQTCLASSQYKSISNLWKPTASKFERHRAASSLSYLRFEKQAADRDTPGAVT